MDEARNNRKPARSITSSEDHVAKKTTRKKLVSTTRDLRRRFSAVRWAINKHLDFVVNHNFRAKTGDKGFDTELEEFFKYVSHRKRYDAAQVHPRRRYMRLLEAARIVDGDVFSLKLRGGRVQAIESDRLIDPNGKKKGENWTQGVRKNRYGVWDQVSIGKRNGTRVDFERKVNASKVIPFGYFDRFDQTRGISPISSSLQEYQDVYEGFDYALAREKVNQFFSFLITRDAEEGFGYSEDDDSIVNTDREPYEVDFGGPVVLDLDPGDDAKFLHAQGTSTESQELWNTVLAIALKAIDIPYSFFKEDYTNFFGSRAALMLYLKSCKWKRDDVVEYEDEWFRWRLLEGELNGEISIPSWFDVENVCNPWQFIPDGIPWWKPSEEVKANIDAVNNYQRSRTEIRQEQWGDDWFDMMERRKEEDEWLEENNYPISVPQQPTIEVISGSNE